MPGAQNRSGKNAVLAATPRAEHDLIAPALERVPLRFRETLQDIGKPLTHIWFPVAGVASIVTEMEDGSIVEVATIGNEGVVALSEIFGVQSIAQRTFIQVPGEADRLTVTDFRALRSKLPALDRMLHRYALALVTQISQGSACNRLHPVEARCARWLLHTHDRVEGASFPLTQEFLAQMLGVTRPSVTVAAGILQKAGLIDYIRGVITVLDRPRLEEAACECYGVITREFSRLLDDK
jgi:CRP-like cAMP-binding protein